MAEGRWGAEPQEGLDEAVARARAGDGAAFDEIYRILAGSVYSYLVSQTHRREDAEDLTGQVFLEAMRGVRGFSGDASAFKGWLFRIAHNRAVDLARRLARRPEGSLEEAEELPAPSATDEAAIAGVARERVWQAVLSLPEQQRRVLILRVGAGLNSREIAEALDKRIGTVKALQHRALSGLARALQDLSDATEEAPPSL
ncbi:MAG TPA: sigma-70 family RNA polymerase sigma factor [Actinomycetota bacterium]|nr:sigma-70 family RNA polymerase sigma factor [Actinomycetota bacterium]